MTSTGAVIRNVVRSLPWHSGPTKVEAMCLLTHAGEVLEPAEYIQSLIVQTAGSMMAGVLNMAVELAPWHGPDLRKLARQCEATGSLRAVLDAVQFCQYELSVINPELVNDL